jgi:ribonuclease BN (tRNA processing enzyme)
MAEESLEWWDIDAIWISHFHLDHCAGIAPFLFATRSAPQRRIEQSRSSFWRAWIA